jgi:transcription elongation factor GreA
MISKKVFNLTIEGRRELEKEMNDLIAQRGEVSERIAEARSFGDLSENAEYSAVRDLQSRSEHRIKDIDHILQNAVIISADKDGKISLGEKVKLSVAGKTVNYQIVGEVEANPLEGKISDKSAIGAALIGRKVGDEVKVTTPKGEKIYKIVKIGE